ncbi:MAG TPA: DUF2635 domain-containing protein [Rhizomicrobium sp.]|jgi:hypothetical protein
MFVKPNAGLKVRDPVMRDFLPAEGREVDDHDLYWHRRLRDKDVLLAAPAQPSPVKTDAAETNEPE